MSSNINFSSPLESADLVAFRLAMRWSYAALAREVFELIYDINPSSPPWTSTAISRAFPWLNSHLLRLCRVWERVYAPGRVCTVGTFATAFWERPKAAIASRRVIGMSSSDSRTQGMQHRMQPGIHRNAPNGHKSRTNRRKWHRIVGQQWSEMLLLSWWGHRGRMAGGSWWACRAWNFPRLL